jgi:hypothetical protein
MVCFQAKNPSLGNFGGPYENVYIGILWPFGIFYGYWDILLPFGRFCVHLVHFSGLGTKKNLATLLFTLPSKKVMMSLVQFYSPSIVVAQHLETKNVGAKKTQQALPQMFGSGS